MKTKPLNKGNHLVFKFLEQTQKAVIACNAMGLTIIGVDFSRIKPSLRVMHNQVTQEMLNNGKAFIFLHSSDDNAIRYCEGQFMTEGIRTVFRIEGMNSNWKPTTHH